MANAVSFGHLSFKSNAAALKYFKIILARTEDNTALTGQDYEDVQALLENHEHAEEKIGSGIVALYVGIEPEKNSRCFHVWRTDDTSDNFSIPKAVKGSTSLRMRFMQAARAAVEDDKDLFKTEYFREHADANGCVQFTAEGPKYSRVQTHVDHDPPFRQIADDFLRQEQLSPASIEYTTKETIGTRFTDPSLTAYFRSYHNKVADLSVISSEDNLKKAWQARSHRPPLAPQTDTGNAP